MLEPVGKLPPEVYWRRRLVALGVLAVVLIFATWMVTSMRSSNANDAARQAASSTTSDAALLPPSSKSEGLPINAQQRPPTSEQAPTSTPPALELGGPQCLDSQLSIAVSTERASYGPGEQPVFTTTITNTSAETCERDLGSGLQQVLVYTMDGSERLWSNIDCFPQTEPDLRALAPGEIAEFTVQWSAMTSTPECLTDPNSLRFPVIPGPYVAVAQLGAITSEGQPFGLS